MEIDDLTVEFGGFAALDSVSHRFEPGTSTAVMGVNGSGKTTMLGCLAGLQRPTAGRVEGMSENLAYVTQVFPPGWMPVTAREVVAMGRFRRLGLIRRQRASDRQAVQRVSVELDVAHLLDRTFGSLSGGQQQRVRIAQALAAEPDVLLLDEPVTGLDIPSQRRILDVMSETAAGGSIVVVTTHHVEEAKHCDAVMLLANRLVAAGTPDEMLTEARLRAAFKGSDLADQVAPDEEDDEMLLGAEALVALRTAAMLLGEKVPEYSHYGDDDACCATRTSDRRDGRFGHEADHSHEERFGHSHGHSHSHGQSHSHEERVGHRHSHGHSH